eukprot:1879273-Rhodomonas_salina.1
MEGEAKIPNRESGPCARAGTACMVVIPYRYWMREFTSESRQFLHEGILMMMIASDAMSDQF